MIAGWSIDMLNAVYVRTSADMERENNRKYSAVREPPEGHVWIGPWEPIGAVTRANDIDHNAHYGVWRRPYGKVTP